MGLFSWFSNTVHKSKSASYMQNYLSIANNSTGGSVNATIAANEYIECAFNLSKKWHSGLIGNRSHRVTLTLCGLMSGLISNRGTEYYLTFLTALSLALREFTEKKFTAYHELSELDHEIISKAFKLHQRESDKLDDTDLMHLHD